MDSQSRILGMISGLQQRRAKTNSVINIVMLIHTNNVFFQNHKILLRRGSSESRVREALYISGMPAPGEYSARCSRTTLKDAVGVSPSVKSLKFTFNFWVSDM